MLRDLPSTGWGSSSSLRTPDAPTVRFEQTVARTGIVAECSCATLVVSFDMVFVFKSYNIAVNFLQKFRKWFPRGERNDDG